MQRTAICTASVISLIMLCSAGAAQTLKKVQDRGTLACGVSQGIEGFSQRDDAGKWSGFDVDFCRALAAAIFNDPGKVNFVPLSTQDRFNVLRAGDIDVLSRNSTWTLSRESSLGLMFAAVTYYDGQSFMLRRSANIDTALELGGSTICVQTGTTTEHNLADYFRVNGMKYELVALSAPAEMLQAYASGRCSVLTSDSSQLYAERAKLPAVADHVILPELISKEPLAPAIRQGDDAWQLIVKWTHFAMIAAEELGVASANIDAALSSTKPDIKRLVGTEDALGEQLGLTRDWAARIVRHVGNYGEVFDRNVGSRSRLGIPRGINALWTHGGMQYAPPIQ
jgi:general L-amino acid transport system substrate-binding protein